MRVHPVNVKKNIDNQSIQAKVQISLQSQKYVTHVDKKASLETRLIFVFRQ